jgi:trk system potassium uptake protein TrkH
MRNEVIIRNLGIVMIFNSFFLLISALIALYYGEKVYISLLYSFVISFSFGVFPYIFVPKSKKLNGREGTAIVVFGWLLTCTIGIIPYLLYGGEFTLTNAWFESVSGYTTTGSTILNSIESLPKGLLFFRSSTHWIGGMGIILFVLVILPSGVKTKKTLYDTEVSELAKFNFHYKASEAVRVILFVYLGLTALETFALIFAGMDWFDAVNHSFATIATGGFSTKDLSVAGFDNVNIEIIIMIFMVLSGIHFGLLYGFIILRKISIFKNPILRYYLIAMLIGILAVTANLFFKEGYSLENSIRYSAFQVISVGTTTGFATYDTIAWSPFVQLILIFFTIQCGCAGSTSGGLKADRVLILFKSIIHEIKQKNHPHGVFPMKIGKYSIHHAVLQNTLTFFGLYLLILFFSTLVISISGQDIWTSFSASAATLGNVGPGFNEVSSLGNYSGIADFAKWSLSANMLFGRLEIYTILTILVKI